MGSYDKTSREIKNKMIDLGLNETLSYVLVPEQDAKMFTKDDYEVVKHFNIGNFSIYRIYKSFDKYYDDITEEFNSIWNSVISVNCLL